MPSHRTIDCILSLFPQQRLKSMMQQLRFGLLVCCCSLASHALSLSKRSIGPHGVIPDYDFSAAKRLPESRALVPLGAKEPLDLELRLSISASSDPPKCCNNFFQNKNNEAKFTEVDDAQTSGCQDLLQMAGRNTAKAHWSASQTNYEPQKMMKDSPASSKTAVFAQLENPLTWQATQYKFNASQGDSLKGPVQQNYPLESEKIVLNRQSTDTNASKRKREDRGKFSILDNCRGRYYPVACPEASTYQTFVYPDGLNEKRESNLNWFRGLEVNPPQAVENHVQGYGAPNFFFAPSGHRFPALQPHLNELAQQCLKKQKAAAQLMSPQIKSAEEPQFCSVRELWLGSAKEHQSSYAEEPRMRHIENPQTGCAAESQIGCAEEPKFGISEQSQIGSSKKPQMETSGDPVWKQQGKMICQSAAFIAYKLAGNVVRRLQNRIMHTKESFSVIETSNLMNLIAVFSYSVLVRCINVEHWKNMEKVLVGFLVKCMKALGGPKVQNDTEKQKLFLSSLKWISEFLCTIYIPQFFDILGDHKENLKSLNHVGRPSDGFETSEATKVIFSICTHHKRNKQGVTRYLTVGTSKWLYQAWVSDYRKNLLGRENTQKIQNLNSLQQWSWELWMKKAEEIRIAATSIVVLQDDYRSSSVDWIMNWNCLLSCTNIQHENLSKFMETGSESYSQMLHCENALQPRYLQSLLPFIPKENQLVLKDLKHKQLDFQTLNFYFKRRNPIFKHKFWIDDVKIFFESYITTTKEFQEELKKSLEIKKSQEILKC